MRRAVGWVLLLGVVLVVAAGAWTASRGWVAYSALQRVRDEVPAVTEAVTALDPDALAASVARVQADADRAREATDDPLWRLASRFPLGGENLAALTTTSASLDRLADDGLPGLQRVVGGVDDARTALTTGQGLDLDALRSALDGLGDVRVASDAARAGLQQIQGDRLLPQVERARDDLLVQLDLAARAEELIASVPLPGVGALSSLPGGLDVQDLPGSLEELDLPGSLEQLDLPETLEELQGLEGDLVPDDLEGALAELGRQLPEGLLPTAP